MRRRSILDPVSQGDISQSSESEQFLMDMSAYNQPNGSKITVDELLASNPTKHGYIVKKSNSILAYLLPCFFSEYQSRYLVLLGGYLYRFKNLNSLNTKGIPIPLDAINIIKTDDLSFEIKTIRKSYHFRVESESECIAWIDAIKLRKVQAIKERMGHAPISESIAKINKKSERLFQKRLCDERREGETTYNPFKDPMIS